MLCSRRAATVSLDVAALACHDDNAMRCDRSYECLQACRAAAGVLGLAQTRSRRLRRSFRVWCSKVALHPLVLHQTVAI